jgi:hypothetical protein
MRLGISATLAAVAVLIAGCAGQGEATGDMAAMPSPEQRCQKLGDLSGDMSLAKDVRMGYFRQFKAENCSALIEPRLME